MSGTVYLINLEQAQPVRMLIWRDSPAHDVNMQVQLRSDEPLLCQIHQQALTDPGSGDITLRQRPKCLCHSAGSKQIWM